MTLRQWLAVSFALAPSPALMADDTPDISGTWAATIDTQVGKQEYNYTFMVKGSQLTGQAKSANGTTAITEGKVEDRKVTFVENLIYQGMPLRIAYTGTAGNDRNLAIESSHTIAPSIVGTFGYCRNAPTFVRLAVKVSIATPATSRLKSMLSAVATVPV